MTVRFLRTVRLAVGDAGEETIIDDLMIRFDIRYEATGTPAAGHIDVLNLHASTETRIRERGTRVRLWAGYGDDPPLIADGDVRRVERMRSEQDRVTRIHFGGNVRRLSGPIFRRTYEGVVAIRRIVTDIVAAMPGLELGPLDPIPAEATEEDVAHDGPARFYLTVRLRPIGVEWYEQDGVIRFSRGGMSADDRQGGDTVIISERSGMIGTPTTTDDGVRVRTLLDPRIRIDTRFRIESSVLDAGAAGAAVSERAEEVRLGEWKAIAVKHAGDNREGSFETEAEGRPA